MVEESGLNLFALEEEVFRMPFGPFLLKYRPMVLLAVL